MNNDNEYLNKILIVIVLYKKDLCQSDSYNSLVSALRSSNVRNQCVDLVIVNNGPSTINYCADNEMFKVHYVEQLDNPGVSKAYNVASKLASYLRKEWLLLFDQDTYLPADFWVHYSLSLSCFPDLPIHAPKLYTGNLLVSPCGYRFHRGYVLNNIACGASSMHDHNVLNSGLLINLEAFEKVGGYDESVRLYFSDFVFFNRLKNVYDTFAIVNVNLKHDLSSSDYSDLYVAMNRFLLYCQGAHAAAKGEALKSVLYFLTIGARSVVMNRRFGTWAFTRIFIQVWCSKQDRNNII